MSKDLKTADKILALDFDHTCYDTDDFVLRELKEKMLDRFDIPTKAWEEAYTKAATIGYSLEQHRQELIKILSEEPCSKEEMEDFDQAIQFDNYLYPDVVPFIQKAKEKGYAVVLLSFGDGNWQDQKVKGSGLDKFLDSTQYIAREEGKGKALQNLVENPSEVVFIDDKSNELDAFLEFFPDAKTYLMNRILADDKVKDDDYLRVRYLEPRKVAEKDASQAHKRCHSLEEVAL